jgi:hypothetical protein
MSTLAACAGFVVVILVYLLARADALRGFAMPPRPYVMPVTAPDFLRFVFDKALYYTLGEYLLLPCVPIGGLPYFQARPMLFYGGAVLVGLVLAALFWRHRREPAGWLGPAWLVGFMLPLLPVFASPHHLYLPGVGWAITIALLLRAVRGHTEPAAQPVGDSARRPWVTRARLLFVRFAVVLGFAVFMTCTYCSSLVFDTGARVEHCLVDEIVATPGGLADGDVLYTANLPVIGHYVRLAVEERTGRRGLRVVPLTWAPRLLGPVTPTELIRVDDHTLAIRLPGDRYFGGPLGQLIREATGAGPPDEVDRTADLGFLVRVRERDAAGVSRLEFRFVRPLSELHLYWGSRARWASPVRFE